MWPAPLRRPSWVFDKVSWRTPASGRLSPLTNFFLPDRISHVSFSQVFFYSSVSRVASSAIRRARSARIHSLFQRPSVSTCPGTDSFNPPHTI